MSTNVSIPPATVTLSVRTRMAILRVNVNAITSATDFSVNRSMTKVTSLMGDFHRFDQCTSLQWKHVRRKSVLNSLLASKILRRAKLAVCAKKGGSWSTIMKIRSTESIDRSVNPNNATNTTTVTPMQIVSSMRTRRNTNVSVNQVNSLASVSRPCWKATLDCLGFYGDGLSCTAHFCSSDGDCGYNAHCLPDEQRPGFSKCVCDPGYLNDGTTFSTCVKDGKEFSVDTEPRSASSPQWFPATLRTNATSMLNVFTTN